MSTTKYFLPRLRYRFTEDGDFKKPKKKIHLASWDIADLKLWLHFIDSAERTGISINNIVFTRPNTFCVSDASGSSLGGYTSSGIAWRWEIPRESRHLFRDSINLFLSYSI